MTYFEVVVDYSGTPLSLKLGVKANSSLVLVHAPRTFSLDAEASVTVSRGGKGPSDVVLAFFTSASKYEEELDVVSRLITPSGGLWIAWPKKASGRRTTMSDHVVRDVALATGLVDNKVCAIDITWTGLRLVWRLDRRGHL
jgi:hypothetical protein